MAKNSMGKMNPTDQKDGNKQSYPKKGPVDMLGMGKGKVKAPPKPVGKGFMAMNKPVGVKAGRGR